MIAVPLCVIGLFLIRFYALALALTEELRSRSVAHQSAVESGDVQEQPLPTGVLRFDEDDLVANIERRMKIQKRAKRSPYEHNRVLNGD